jgi:C_GCAxxG_C_C family probable redox protein
MQSHKYDMAIKSLKKEKPHMKKQPSLFSERAASLFKQDYNCAQSVLLTMQEYYGIRRNKLVPKIATAFGGGIGRRGSLCGALTGVIMAIGLKHGTNKTVMTEKEKAYEIALKFYDEFVRECGSPFCRELIGYDLTNPKDLERMRESNVRQEKCFHFVKKAVEIIVDLEARANQGMNIGARVEE